MLELRPILGLLGGYLVSYLVGHGYVDQGNATLLQGEMNGFVGLMLALVTTVYGLHNLVHKPTLSKDAPSREASSPTSAAATVEVNTAPALAPQPVVSPVSVIDPVSDSLDLNQIGASPRVEA